MTRTELLPLLEASSLVVIVVGWLYVIETGVFLRQLERRAPEVWGSLGSPKLWGRSAATTRRYLVQLLTGRLSTSLSGNMRARASRLRLYFIVASTLLALVFCGAWLT